MPLPIALFFVAVVAIIVYAVWGHFKDTTQNQALSSPESSGD